MPYWLGKDGVWRAKGRSSIGTPVVTTPTTPTTPTPTNPPDDGQQGIPTPDVPTIKYTDLFRSGDTVGDAFNRMTTRAAVELPVDFDEEIVDFKFATGTYGIWSNKCLGIIGPGKMGGVYRARMGLRPNSSTQIDKAFAQSQGGTIQLYLARVGGLAAGERTQTVMRGFEIYGTDQAVSAANENQPHSYNGMINYNGMNTVWEDLLLRGVAPGYWNSPPGETFSLNGYKDYGSVFRNIEVDGRNPAGRRTSGSPLGGNNSDHMLVEDCYFHDSYVSGLTWSFTGRFDVGASQSKNITTRRVFVENNANHLLQAGKRFTGFNHENVGGYVRHYSPRIKMTQMTEWNQSHMAFNMFNMPSEGLVDNQDIEIHNPNWGGQSFSKYNGMFTVNIDKYYAWDPGTNTPRLNAQQTAPKVFINGNQLTPIWLTKSPTNNLTNDPTKFFVVVQNQG
jgi:hypothetical protein